MNMRGDGGGEGARVNMRGGDGGGGWARVNMRGGWWRRGG